MGERGGIGFLTEVREMDYGQWTKWKVRHALTKFLGTEDEEWGRAYHGSRRGRVQTDATSLWMVQRYPAAARG